MNVAVYDALRDSADFCAALGRMILAAGRLESDIREFLKLHGIAVGDGAALGPLLGALETGRFLNENGVRVLRSIKERRNVLTHNLYGLFAGRVESRLLHAEEFSPADVDYFIHIAGVLEDDLVNLSSIVEGKVREDASGRVGGATHERLLIRP